MTDRTTSITESRDTAEALLPERIVRYRRDDLRVLYCNAAQAAVFDRTPEEVIGRGLDEFLSADAMRGLREQIDLLGPHHRFVSTIQTDRRHAQPTRWFERVDQWQPGRDGDEVLSVGRDVTARERSRRRLGGSEGFRIAVADAPIGMALVGLDGRLLEVNRALCDLLGRDEVEVIGTSTLDITHPDDVAHDLAYGQAVLRGDHHPGLEKRFERPDGTTVWGWLTLSAVRDEEGEPTHLIGQVVDITGQVRREQLLRDAAESERLAAARLRQLDEVKNAFLTAISHELRTPLTVVRGVSATLRRLGDHVDGSTRQRLQAAMDTHTERLSTLLEDLLDLERLTRGATPQDLGEFDLVALVRAEVADSGVRTRTAVIAPDELWVAADEVQVQRIVSNLLDNAGKYAPQGTIEVVLAATDTGGFRIEVADEGPGVAPEERDRVFDPFYRAAIDHPKPGTGVGLALVREFARLHGGTAWVADGDAGARFVVEVPGEPVN